MSERRFPVLFGSNRTGLIEAGCPRDVPWDFIARCAPDCLRNHDQTPQQLAFRGGLDPWEMMAVVQRKRWRDVSATPMQDVVAWLVKATGEETDLEIPRAEAGQARALIRELAEMLERRHGRKTDPACDVCALLARHDVVAARGK